MDPEVSSGIIHTEVNVSLIKTQQTSGCPELLKKFSVWKQEASLSQIQSLQYVNAIKNTIRP